ncbi:hypothetical protein [Paraburkholderia humisilvae]|nr:hypothetical protein [Paraburkholderia humisilvae]
MKTNAKLLPLLDQDQYVLFSLNEVGHYFIDLKTGERYLKLDSNWLLTPGILCGCEFFTVRWVDRGSRLVFYLVFHMSGKYEEIKEMLKLVKMLAAPDSITVTTAHNPPDCDVRPTIVANELSIPLENIKHEQNGNPFVMLSKLQ